MLSIAYVINLSIVWLEIRKIVDTVSRRPSGLRWNEEFSILFYSERFLWPLTIRDKFKPLRLANVDWHVSLRFDRIHSDESLLCIRMYLGFNIRCSDVPLFVFQIYTSSYFRINNINICSSGNRIWDGRQIDWRLALMWVELLFLGF